MGGGIRSASKREAVLTLVVEALEAPPLPPLMNPFMLESSECFFSLLLFFQLLNAFVVFFTLTDREPKRRIPGFFSDA